MVQETKGIVLRTVKYGETSLIVSIFTELFGLQSYIINGVRSSSKKAGPKAGMFQPAMMLDMVVYHNEFKNIQRIKEYKLYHIYKNLLSDIPRNAVALFIIELLVKCLKQPEANPELFYFVEDALMHLDTSPPAVTANMPLFFALHLAVFFGFRISGEEAGAHTYLDLEEGAFTDTMPVHRNYLQEQDASAAAHILQTMHPSELIEVHLNQESRRRILSALELYYALHVPDFGTMRTLPVLREIMS